MLALLIPASIGAQQPASATSSDQKPIRIAVAGTAHGHVSWILNRKDKPDAVVVGIYETDKQLVDRQVDRYKLDASMVFTDLNLMLDKVKPDAVVAFGSIYDHMKVVEAAAPRGIHIMVEKPLATNMKHVLKMQELAAKYKVKIMTNYETSWYPTTEKTYQLVHDSNYVGQIRKVVIHDGHEGPKEIGVGKEFFDWLTDPVQNGGGALIDFGCYGANLMTWLMKGEMPLSVTAVTAQYKPEIYPKVEDEASIIVAYKGAQCIIQASWNWPFSRKDMEVYGQTGYIITANQTQMRKRNKAGKAEEQLNITAAEIPVYTDPFQYLADVIREKITIPPYGLYSLENNAMVVRILEAARESAKLRRTVFLK
ncbi:MAG: Gfo/Idh/MocA family oxidoreductase [Chitinophagaceae bacterium]|nr:MAG: Gfo/Idh/MocA family oxidoreductase [Chitinophagaceae bacterium]